jgi:ABC-2 type transport system permease protein
MIADPARPTPAQAVADTAVMMRRELLATIRKPTLLVLVFVEPLMLILLFRYVFGGAIQTPNGSYVDYLVPGLLVLTAVFGSLVTCIGLSQDLARGMVDRLRSLPMAPSAVLLGRTLSDLVRNVASLAFMFAVAVLIGFRPGEPVLRVLAAMALLLGFSYVFSWISAVVALAVRDPETAQSAGLVWVFPLTFASSTFVPTDSMPAAVQAFARVNPITLCSDAVRALTIGGDATTAVLGTVAWFVGLMAIFVPLAMVRYRALRYVAVSAAGSDLIERARAHAMLLRAEAGDALEGGAQGERAAVADLLGDRADRGVGLAQQVGCQVQPPAGEKRHRRLPHELVEPARERGARDVRGQRERGDGPGVRGVVLQHAQRAADDRVAVGAVPRRRLRVGP